MRQGKDGANKRRDPEGNGTGCAASRREKRHRLCRFWGRQGDNWSKQLLKTVLAKTLAFSLCDVYGAADKNLPASTLLYGFFANPCRLVSSFHKKISLDYGRRKITSIPLFCQAPGFFLCRGRIGALHT
jgi:hypothetical protein